MIINLDYASRIPIYEQIVNEIERYVALGILKEKDQIMSIRELASTLGINPNTVKKAYTILENKNIIMSISTKGTFIKDNAKQIKKDSINKYFCDIENTINKLEKLGLTREEIIKNIKNM